MLDNIEGSELASVAQRERERRTVQPEGEKEVRVQDERKVTYARACH
jgi:hypothetical protein